MASTTATAPEAGTSSAGIAAVAEVARRLLPEDGVITDRARLRTYECDGLAHYRVTPALVVLPETTEQVAAVVRACAEHGVPFVARGPRPRPRAVRRPPPPSRRRADRDLADAGDPRGPARRPAGGRGTRGDQPR